MRYTLWIERETGELVPEELYDLKPTGHERINLAGDEAFRNESVKYRSWLTETNALLKNLLDDEKPI